MIITPFNRQLIDEFKRVNSTKFDEAYDQYVRIIEQGAPPPDAAASTPPPPPPDMGGAPAMPPDAGGAPPPPEVVPNKSYPEILEVIAKALTLNLNQSPSDASPENVKNIEHLKDFVGEVLEGSKVKQMDNSKALRMLDLVRRSINSVVGGIEEI